MKIAFDFQAFSQQFGGVSNYFVNLAANLSALGDDVKVISPIYQNQYLKKLSDEIGRGFYLPAYPRYSKRLIKGVNKIFSPRLINNFDPKILHETYYSKSFCSLRDSQRRVLTVFDMIHEKFPEYFLRHDSTITDKKHAIDRSDKIICISNTTRDDLLNFYSIPIEKISVIYLGFDAPHKFNPSTATNTNIGKKNNLIYVGSRDGYKNFNNFLVSFSKSRLSQDFKLLVIGGGNFSADELKQIHSLGLNEKQVEHVAAGSVDLGKYYSESAALVYPSIYEGFGLPPLEAMSYGCPVISSNTGSMPEILGDAASYFNPFSTDSISHAIESVVYDSDNLRRLIFSGFKQTHNYSWEKCALQTRLVYESII